MGFFGRLFGGQPQPNLSALRWTCGNCKSTADILEIRNGTKFHQWGFYGDKQLLSCRSCDALNFYDYDAPNLRRVVHWNDALYETLLNIRGAIICTGHMGKEERAFEPGQRLPTSTEEGGIHFEAMKLALFRQLVSEGTTKEQAVRHLFMMYCQYEGARVTRSYDAEKTQMEGL